MPFAFLIVGTLCVFAGVRNQASTLLTLVKSDLTGSDNYIYWMLSILVLGSLGYVQTLRPVSRMMLALVIVCMILKRGNGFFSQFGTAISQA